MKIPAVTLLVFVFSALFDATFARRNNDFENNHELNIKQETSNKVNLRASSVTQTTSDENLHRGSGHRSLQMLSDWEFCSSSDQCNDECCSSYYSDDGNLRCTPVGGYDPTMCVGSGFAPAPAPTGGDSGNGSVLYANSGGATFYYDITGRSCSGPPYVENQGYPTCTSSNPSFLKMLQDYGTNNIVAVDNRLLQGDLAKYCGKQIKIYKDGGEVTYDGKPFVVFDGCHRCADDGGITIDFSLSALDALDNGNACNDGYVNGFSWEIIDNQIIPYVQ